MKKENTYSNILMNSILENVHSLRTHSSEAKKEHLPTLIPLPQSTLFNKNIFRRTRLFPRPRVESWSRCVTMPRRFVRLDATPVEHSSTPAGCQKISGETRAISGLASRRSVAFHPSSVPSDRSLVERNETFWRSNGSSVLSPDVSGRLPRRAGTSPRTPGDTNETCVEKNESFSSIPQTRVASPRSSVERNEPRVRSYRRGVAKNESSVAPTNLSEGCVSLFANLPVLQMNNIGYAGIKI